jgi:hypothetical protein
MATKLNMLLQVRRDDFTAHGSYVLLAGEPGYCTVKKVFKIGDGTTTWENLGFANEAEIRAIVKATDDKFADYYTKTEADGKHNALQATVDAHGEAIATLQGADVTINAAIEAEAKARDDADKAINAKIGTVADGENLAALIVAEKDRAEAAEKVNADAIAVLNGDGEGSVAKAAADAEAAAKSHAETKANEAKQAAIDAAVLNTTEKVNAEAAAREAADNALDGRLDTVEAKLADVSKVMDFVGAAEALPAEGANQSGDVIVITAGDNAGKEFVYDDSREAGHKWVEFGSTSAADAAIAALQGRMDTAESDIAAAEGRLDTAEGDIDALEKAVSDAQADIDGLEASLAEGGATANAIAAAHKAGTDAQAVIDANKATWDKAGTAVQNSDFETFKNTNTQAIADAVAPKLDKSVYDAYINGKAMSDAELKAYADEAAGEAETNAIAKADAALVEANKYTDAEIAKVAAKAGVSEIIAGTDIVVTEDAEDASKVTVAHATYSTGTLKDAAHDSATDPSFLTSISFTNGHITGATVQNLATVLANMEFILDGGNASDAE